MHIKIQQTNIVLNAYFFLFPEPVFIRLISIQIDDGFYPFVFDYPIQIFRGKLRATIETVSDDFKKTVRLVEEKIEEAPQK